VRVQNRIWLGRGDTETRTPLLFYLFVVETLNAGSDMAMMDQPLVLQYGVCFFAFSLTDCLMRTQASNSTTSPVVRPVSPSVPAASLC
jgi:hypothetical protein